MRKFLLFAFAVLMFTACAEDTITEQQSIQPIVDEASATLVVGFEDDETRIQLNEDRKTVWTKGDCVSAFYRSDANQKWQYNGKTGIRTGELECVDKGMETTKTSRIVIVYPYDENYGFDPATYTVATSMPATQTYMEDSFGLDGNLMVSSSEYNQFVLKSVYGWVKLQLTGNGEKVKSISVCGNAGEQVAGDAVINTSDATMMLAADGDMSDVTILTEVTLDCGEGVELGAEATAFYIALPPQTYTKGITVDIKAVDGSTMTKSTDKALTIERNHIQPMATLVYDSINAQPNNEIWYWCDVELSLSSYYVNNFGYTTIFDGEKYIIRSNEDITSIYTSIFSISSYFTEPVYRISFPSSLTNIQGDVVPQTAQVIQFNSVVPPKVSDYMYISPGKVDYYSAIWTALYEVPNNAVDAYKVAWLNIFNKKDQNGYITTNYYYTTERIRPISNEQSCINYTTNDGKPIEFKSPSYYKIVSHTFENGTGTITFNRPLTHLWVDAFNMIETSTDNLTSLSLPNTLFYSGYQAITSKTLKEISFGDSVFCVDWLGTIAGYHTLVICLPQTIRYIGGGIHPGNIHIYSNAKYAPAYQTTGTWAIQDPWGRYDTSRIKTYAPVAAKNNGSYGPNDNPIYESTLWGTITYNQ